MPLQKILERFSEILSSETELLLTLCNNGGDGKKEFLQHFLDFLRFVPSDISVNTCEQFFQSVDTKKLELDVIVKFDAQAKVQCTLDRSCYCKQQPVVCAVANLSEKMLDSLIESTISALEDHLQL